MNYSIQEKTDMILIIGESFGNCLLAARVYAERYNDRRRPNKRFLEKLLATFKTTGSVNVKRKTSKVVTDNEENQFVTLASVVQDPHVSTRVVARETGLSQSSVSRILRKHKYHPYHIEMHQHLYGTDFQKRLEFCLRIMDEIGEKHDFLSYVLFTDESTFHNNGLVNRHNFHYYDTENRHLFRTTDRQNRWSLNVFGGIIGDYVVGPYFFDGHLNGRQFLEFLRTDFWILLENIPLNIRQTMWIQLDGAPAHFSTGVRTYLNRKFPNKWIGRGGSIDWPPRSPGLTPMDYFLWGYVKNLVFNTPPTTPENMQERIRNAFHTITPNMLFNVRRSFEKRAYLCIQADGHHFEQILQ